MAKFDTPKSRHRLRKQPKSARKAAPEDRHITKTRARNADAILVYVGCRMRDKKADRYCECTKEGGCVG